VGHVAIRCSITAVFEVIKQEVYENFAVWHFFHFLCNKTSAF